MWVAWGVRGRGCRRGLLVLVVGTWHVGVGIDGTTLTLIMVVVMGVVFFFVLVGGAGVLVWFAGEAGLVGLDWVVDLVA